MGLVAIEADWSTKYVQSLPSPRFNLNGALVVFVPRAIHQNFQLAIFESIRIVGDREGYRRATIVGVNMSIRDRAPI